MAGTRRSARGRLAVAGLLTLLVAAAAPAARATTTTPPAGGGGEGTFTVGVAGDVNGKTAYMRLVPDFSLYPDFNADGAVDGADLRAWQQGLGVGTTVAQGDADRDQDVDAADLAMWRTSFGAVAPPAVPAAIGVPEPVGYVGMSWAAALWAGRRRKALADPS